MLRSKGRPTFPKSIRQKQILDLATEQPDASLEELAAEIPSATAELVENVLKEYGDPAKDQSESAPDTPNPQMIHENHHLSPDDLTKKELETLYAIREHPEASQRELAKVLDISGATISDRVNSIEGFDWAERQSFAEAVLKNGSDATVQDRKMRDTDADYEATLDQLVERITAVEQRLEESANDSDSSAGFDNPELIHKVAHASLRSDAITEDEELRILKVLVNQ